MSKNYAIIRVEKIKTRSGVVQREKHNDRTKETPNADPERLSWNKEYVNLENRPILELLDARVAEAGVPLPRANATICMEILLTGSPNAALWQRTPDKDGNPGLAADMRGSQWEADIVAFAHREWGKNLIGLKLHQDEHTPHFQAFVVPLVGRGGGHNGENDPKHPLEPLPPDAPARRSARDLFSPHRLALLQTDYARVVEPHGFERGIEGSRAQHKTMAQMYGLLEKSAKEIAPFIEARNAEPYKLPPLPPLLAPWERQVWVQKAEEDINARLQASQDRLRIAGRMAVTAAAGDEASARSREWIEKEKGHKVDLGQKVEDRGFEVMHLELKLDVANLTVRKLTDQLEEARARETQQVEKHATQQDKLARQAVQNMMPPEVLERAKEQLRAVLKQVREDVVKALTLPVASEQVAWDRIRYSGYRWEGVDANNQPYLVDNRTGARFQDAQVRPDGRSGPPLAEQITQAVEATQQATKREEQISVDRQLASMREDARRQHLAYEERELGKFRSEIDRRNYEVARIRVPAEHVADILKLHGKNTVHVDAKPGDDKLVGINLVYTPTASGTCAYISQTLDLAKKLGGEVYEAESARTTRELNADRDYQRARSYSLNKSREQELGL